MERKKSPTVWQDFLEKNFFFFTDLWKACCWIPPKIFHLRAKLKKKKCWMWEKERKRKKKYITLTQSFRFNCENTWSLPFTASHNKKTSRKTWPHYFFLILGTEKIALWKNWKKAVGEMPWDIVATVLCGKRFLTSVVLKKFKKQM